MTETLKCITPVDGSVYVERPLADETEIAEALVAARAAQAAWRRTPLAERGWTAYMAFAATLAAGLHGIDQELELPKAFAGNMYAAKRVPDVPKTLRAALAAFKKSKVLRAAFGDPVVDHYLHAGEWEQAEYDRRITDWEVIRYFERA